MCFKHDWLKENAYHVDGGDVQQEHCGQVRICLKCGNIKVIGLAYIPTRFKDYRQNINDGRKWYQGE